MSNKLCDQNFASPSSSSVNSRRASARTGDASAADSLGDMQRQTYLLLAACHAAVDKAMSTVSRCLTAVDFLRAGVKFKVMAI